MTDEMERRREGPAAVVVGVGHWGKNVVRNFHELGALAGFCEEDPARREEFAGRYPDADVYASFDEVLGSSDPASAISIATPAETHGELVRRALEADRDVLVEKPLCLSVDEGEDLVALARDRGRILMVGHLLWYHPAVLKLRELVADGELGRIQYIYSNRLNLGKIRQSENILWSFAPHDVSVILGLLGEMPDGIVAMGGNYLNESIADVTVSLLTFPSGVRAHVFVSWLHPFKEQKLVVVGDRRMAVFDDLEETHKLVVYPHSIEWQSRLPVAKKALAEPVELEMGEPLRAECQHFLERIEDRGPPRTDGQEALRVLRVLRACQDGLERQPHSRAALVEA
jgi:UDP-2-acetamido-3-amino-2,3-dideoxy-glucuronate N-acetyltransferase